eukprot:s293_g34.t1
MDQMPEQEVEEKPPSPMDEMPEQDVDENPQSPNEPQEEDAQADVAPPAPDAGEAKRPSKRVYLRDLTPNSKEVEIERRKQAKRDNSNLWHARWQSAGVPKGESEEQNQDHQENESNEPHDEEPRQEPRDDVDGANDHGDREIAENPPAGNPPDPPADDTFRPNKELLDASVSDDMRKIFTARPAHRYLFSCGDMVSFAVLCFAALQAILATGEDPSPREESCMLQSVAHEDKQRSCGWDVDCPQDYSIKEVSQARGGVSEAERKERHQKALSACTVHDGKYVSPTGGYCYVATDQNLISKDEHVIDQDFFLPSNYHLFDEGLARAISKLVFKDGDWAQRERERERDGSDYLPMLGTCSFYLSQMPLPRKLKVFQFADLRSLFLMLQAQKEKVSKTALTGKVMSPKSGSKQVSTSASNSSSMQRKSHGAAAQPAPADAAEAAAGSAADGGAAATESGGADGVQAAPSTAGAEMALQSTAGAAAESFALVGQALVPVSQELVPVDQGLSQRRDESEMSKGEKIQEDRFQTPAEKTLQRSPEGQLQIQNTPWTDANDVIVYGPPSSLPLFSPEQIAQLADPRNASSVLPFAQPTMSPAMQSTMHQDLPRIPGFLQGLFPGYDHLQGLREAQQRDLEWRQSMESMVEQLGLQLRASQNENMRLREELHEAKFMSRYGTPEDRSLSEGRKVSSGAQSSKEDGVGTQQDKGSKEASQPKKRVIKEDGAESRQERSKEEGAETRQGRSKEEGAESRQERSKEDGAETRQERFDPFWS